MKEMKYTSCEPDTEGANLAKWGSVWVDAGGVTEWWLGHAIMNGTTGTLMLDVWISGLHMIPSCADVG